MSSNCLFRAAFYTLATALPAMSQTVLMDATTNNGSFETRDPSDAPFNTGLRRTGTGGTFSAANWTITTTGFGGIDGNSIGAQEGETVLLANHNTSVTFISDEIFQPIANGDSFDLSFFTARNTANSTFDYTVSVRFDGDESTDLLLLTGSANEPDAAVWLERTVTGIVYSAEASVGSVQVVINVANNTGGPVDQVYLDNLTLTANVAPPPPGDDDMDGISNEDEISGALNPYDGTGNFVGAGNGGAPTNSFDSDSDDDGLSDNEEITGANGFITNPNSVDTDSDGINDLDERDATIGFAILTDPTKNDTDGDTLLDIWELENMLDPNDDGLGDGDPNNGEEGDPDDDLLLNFEEFDLGTDPQNPDTDGDGVRDGDEISDSTDPLDPDEDNDGLQDGEETNSDPTLKDSDFDGFSDFTEVNLFMTDPDNEESKPDVTVHMDFMTNNGSFENIEGATNPSGSVGAGCRYAASADGTSATLPGWTAEWQAGFIGFDCTNGLSSEGSEFAFVNAGSQAVYQSDPIPASIGLGEEFLVQIDTSNNVADETAELNVSLIFDGGEPVLVEALTIDGGDEPNEYVERRLATYTTLNGARSVAIRLELDNTATGNDQPRFDNVRIYSMGGTPVALPARIVDFQKAGDNVTLIFESTEGRSYSAFYSPDLTDFVAGGTPQSLTTMIDGAAGETQTSSTFNLAETFGVGMVPDVLFFLVRENIAETQ